MLISGLQKLTLLDYPGKVACTVFTGGCNFRCPFCHNSALVLPEQLAHDSSEDAVLSFLRKRVGVLDGVAVTGGEPLLHADIGDFLKEVKALGFLVKLDTNGSFPERLISLVEAGLVDRVAMDIKNAPALYAKTAGLARFDLAALSARRISCSKAAWTTNFAPRWSRASTRRKALQRPRIGSRARRNTICSNTRTPAPSSTARGFRASTRTRCTLLPMRCGPSCPPCR